MFWREEANGSKYWADSSVLLISDARKSLMPPNAHARTLDSVRLHGLNPGALKTISRLSSKAKSSCLLKKHNQLINTNSSLESIYFNHPYLYTYSIMISCMYLRPLTSPPEAVQGGYSVSIRMFAYIFYNTLNCYLLTGSVAKSPSVLRLRGRSNSSRRRAGDLLPFGWSLSQRW